MKKAILFSHTHWDREWHRTFQEFQYSLVEMMDRMIATLEADPEFRIFHLDGQTILLHDYLEIRPENRPRLEKLAREGRLVLGPFYILGDDFLQSGESHIRNFLIGGRDCRAFGSRPMKVGYYTDTFGHGAQTPQILRGFLIENAILFRGINTRDRGAHFFKWEGSNGSSVFTHLLHPLKAYSNMFFALWDFTDDLAPEAIESVIREIEFQATGTDSSLVLLADGIDHAFARPNLPEIARRIRTGTGGKMTAEFDTLETFLDLMRGQFGARARKVKGELFDTNADSVSAGALATNCLSSRQNLKTLNHQLEIQLTRYTEPMAVVAHLYDQPYPRAFLDKAWRLLLQNQIHDSIGGCSIDRVHEDMLFRFNQVSDLASTIYRRSLLAVSRRSDGLNDFFGGKTLSIFNPGLAPFSGVVETVIHWPEGDASPAGFALRDNREKLIETQMTCVGTETPAEYLETRKTVHGRRWHSYQLQFELKNFPGMCLDYFEIIPQASKSNRVDAAADRIFSNGPGAKTGLVATARSIENKSIRLDVEPDGTVSLTDKATGNRFSGLLTFEDRGDIGDGWVKIHPKHDKIIYHIGTPVSVSLIAEGSLRSSLRLEMEWKLPAAFDLRTERRSDQTTRLPVSVTLHLDTNAAHVDAEIEVDNTVRDHCLRLLFPSDTKATTYQSDTQFIVNDRPVETDTKPDYIQSQPKTWPMQTFINIESKDRGLTVVSSSGHHECEVLPGRNTLALTLYRSTRKTVGTNGEEGGQLLQKQMFRVRIIPHSGSWKKSRIPLLADQFNCPPAVQQLELENASTPAPIRMLEAGPASVLLSAYKLAETNDDLICRLWEPAGEAKTISFRLPAQVRKVGQAQLNEEPVGKSQSGNSIAAKIDPHEIFTLRAGC